MKNSLFIFLCFCGAGPPGPPGPPGPTGPAAELDTVAVVNCSKVAGPRIHEYYSIQLSSGFRFVEAAVIDLGAAYSATCAFGANQSGATTGGCSVGYDIDTASGGFWYYSLTPLQARYSDPTSPAHGQLVTFDPADCQN